MDWKFDPDPNLPLGIDPNTDVYLVADLGDRQYKVVKYYQGWDDPSLHAMYYTDGKVIAVPVDSVEDGKAWCEAHYLTGA